MPAAGRQSIRRPAPRKMWCMQPLCRCHHYHQAASILLKHTLSLLQKAGGAGNRVLVDGGTALAKAVKNENELRQLLEDFVLVLRRCLAHCLRRPLSRGGGYQGGKGSVHNALIKNNVPRKVVGKIVGLLIMMTFIPPDKKESYGNAIDLLIQEYDKYLPPNFRATYLSKDPNDLGGLCAGRAGEVASTQGMERRGGYIKKCFRETCKSFGLGTKSGNPLMLISALAIDGMRNQNNIANIAVEPNRKKVASSYALLRTFANYRVPRPDDLLCNLRVNHNFCSDFLYCLCIATIINESGSPVETEVPLFSVLGKEDAEFKITFPSISAQCTELKQMKMEEVLDVIGGPAALQMQSMSAESVTTMLKDPRGCAKALTRLDYASQQTLKLRIHSRLVSVITLLSQDRERHVKTSFEDMPIVTNLHLLVRVLQRSLRTAQGRSRRGRDQSSRISLRRTSGAPTKMKRKLQLQ